MDSPQELFERLGRLSSRAQTVTASGRLDLADDAERLALDVRRVFNERPINETSAVLRLIGEIACSIANDARARA